MKLRKYFSFKANEEGGKKKEKGDGKKKGVKLFSAR